MGLTNPKVVIPLVWLGCTASYFVAVFWMPRPDFVVPAIQVSGILEIWLHEVMRSAPVMIPGFGVFWGVLSGVGFAHTSFFVMEKGISGTAVEHLVLLFPFLSLHMLAQGIMIRRGILVILELVRHDNSVEMPDVPTHESATASTWGEQESTHESFIQGRFAIITKPILRDVGIFFALLFASAVITFIAWGDAPSGTTIQAFWMYDGMFDYLLALPSTTIWPMDEFNSVVGTIWESLT